jgi:hypothetical protein
MVGGEAIPDASVNSYCLSILHFPFVENFINVSVSNHIGIRYSFKKYGAFIVNIFTYPELFNTVRKE